MHKRAREHKRLVLLQKIFRKWSRHKKEYVVRVKSDWTYIWEDDIGMYGVYLPDFPINAKEYKKIRR